MLPWLSASRGGDAVLQVFRESDHDKSKPDIYVREAGGIYDAPTEAIDEEKRQIGKVAVLSLGFGGADGALAAMAANYGVYLEADFRARIVERWRANNSWAVSFWGAHGQKGSYGLWGAINRAMEQPETVQPVGRVAYVYDRSYLGGTVFCALPCGRLLTYPRIKWEKREVEDKRTGKLVEKVQMTYLRGYGRSALWYGKLAENITQAAAGSLLRHTLVDCRRELPWMPVVAHTHDEIVTRHDEAESWVAREALTEIMTREREWHAGLPLKVGVSQNWYYSKAVK